MTHETNPLAPILDELVAELPQLIESTCAEIFREQASYDNVTPESLAESITSNMKVAISALSDGVASSPEHLDAAMRVTAERHKAGIPLDQVILAFRVSISQIHESFITKAAHRVPPEEFATSTGVIWKVSDAFIKRVVETYHDLEMEKALNSEVQRIATIHSLINGEILEKKVLQSLGLNPALNYAVMICEIDRLSQKEREQLKVQVVQNGGVAILEQTLIAIVDTIPSLPPNVNAGVSPLLPISDISVAYQIAKTCTIANRSSDDIIGTVEKLTWRMAVVENLQVSSLLHDRYIKPCLELGDTGVQLLETVYSWLLHSRKISPTAGELHLHVNTVRYRIDKFSELTGFNLENAHDTVDALWALENWKVHPSSLL